MLESRDGPKILEINSSPGLEGIERASGIDVAGAIVAYAERFLARRGASKKRRDAVIEAERRIRRLKSEAQPSKKTWSGTRPRRAAHAGGAGV
jgi:ribosomal protein S6--L-glutamate ligase